jgi:O-antigen/teichoic acid export membrane protein
MRTHPRTNIALLDQGLVSIGNFGTSVVLARNMGAEQFGTFALVYIAIVFITNLQQALIITPMFSIGPKQSVQERNHYFSSVFSQQLLFSAAAFGTAILVITLLHVVRAREALCGLALPVAVAVCFLTMQDFLRRWCFVRGNGFRALLSDGISYLGQLGVFILLQSKWTPATAFWVIGATSFLALVPGYPMFATVRLPGRAFKRVLGRHWASARWLAPSCVVSWIAGNVPVYGLGLVLGPSAVGGLRATQNVMAVTHIALQGLPNVITVHAATLLKNGCHTAFTSYLRRLVLWLTSGMAVAGVALSLLAPPLLTKLYGPAYAPYASLVPFWAGIYCLLFLSLPIATGLKSLERVRSLFYADAVACILGLGLAYPLIHRFGLKGILICYLLSQSATVFITGHALAREIKKARGEPHANSSDPAIH